VILCHDVIRFDSESDRKFKVVDKLETFIHKQVDRTYRIPSDKSKIFIVKRA
jgi:hypothetical protein